MKKLLMILSIASLSMTAFASAETNVVSCNCGVNDSLIIENLNYSVMAEGYTLWVVVVNLTTGLPQAIALENFIGEYGEPQRSCENALLRLQQVKYCKPPL